MVNAQKAVDGDSLVTVKPFQRLSEYPKKGVVPNVQKVTKKTSLATVKQFLKNLIEDQKITVTVSVQKVLLWGTLVTVILLKDMITSLETIVKGNAQNTTYGNPLANVY
jgi:hypothetical protein